MSDKPVIRNEPMTNDEFEAWADTIELADWQRSFVQYVIQREYRRGRYGFDAPDKLPDA